MSYDKLKAKRDSLTYFWLRNFSPTLGSMNDMTIFRQQPFI